MSAEPTTLIEVLADEVPLLDLCAHSAPDLAALHCHPDLIEHVEELGRVARGALVYVAGCPVLIDRDSGLPFAAAWGTATLVLHLGQHHPGVLSAEPARVTGLNNHWWTVTPWPQDFTFQRGKDLLRAAVTSAAATRRV